MTRWFADLVRRAVADLRAMNEAQVELQRRWQRKYGLPVPPHSVPSDRCAAPLRPSTSTR